MKANLPLVKRFCDLIDEGSQILATLCDLSDQEKNAIEKVDPALLQNCVSQKQKNLELLAENTLQRNEALIELGFSADAQGLEQLQQSLSPGITKEISKRWENLSSQLRQAAKLNQRNEQIVKRSQGNISQLLSILQGQSPKTTIYDEAGHKGNYSGQNKLGKA
ncbi:MAG: flagellar protein FlgN [Motiliproteus sp.]